MAAGAELAAGAAIEPPAGAELAGAMVESAFLLFFDDFLLVVVSVEVEVFAAGAVLPEAAAGAAAESALAAFFDFFDFFVVVVD